jgi:predicted nucleic acid-binding protein
MEASSKRIDSLVIDASIAVWAVIPTVAPLDTLNLIGGWRRRGVRLISPSLFLAESTSAIRRLVHGGILSEEEGTTALTDLLDLDIDIVQEIGEHCRSAFRWAERLDQSKAYDGFYLAIAEYVDSELWTADERLAHSARDKNINWVHWAGETATTTST